MLDPIRSAAGRTPQCPDLEMLASPDQAIRRHVEACPHCRSELALLHEFEAAEPQPHETADVEWVADEVARRRSRIGQAVRPSRAGIGDWVRALLTPGRPRMLAAAGVMLAVVAVVGMYPRRDAGPALRPPDNLVWRSGAFETLTPAGNITEAPKEFRWEGVTGAAKYRIELMQVDRTVVWTEEAAQTVVRIPETVQAQFVPGRSFQWRVTALQPSGQIAAVTNLQSFHMMVTRR